MKKIIQIAAIILCVTTFNISDLSAQEDKSSQNLFVWSPSLNLPEALSLAQNYIKENNIDTSKHYLDNIRLIADANWEQGKYWLLSWLLTSPADGGQIFIMVSMDKQIKIKHGI